MTTLYGIGPYGKVFYECVAAACRVKASDIHIEPVRDGVQMRFRVFGDMTPPWKSFGVEHQRSFINEVKRLTNLSIATSGRAQDGRVAMDFLGVDLRVSLLPSLYGEKIVLRVLDLKRSFRMSDLGFDQDTAAALDGALRAKNGVILISGPTGSGKTTTLYSLLMALDPKTKNIITLEDPIEYRLPGITQVRITSKLSFADALRSVLRQDPDVILVGEIRDEETADLCFKAASTGHLVLSTIHANCAREVCERLSNLGVEEFLVRSNLRLSAAQRLVKHLCGECAVPASNERLDKLNIGSTGRYMTRSLNAGCPKCVGGVTGRIALLEYLTGPEIRFLLANSGQEHPDKIRSLGDAFQNAAAMGMVDVEDIHEVA